MSKMQEEDRYKTELCRNWVELKGRCRYGEKCQFAHGEEELRLPVRHPKYKTEICKNWLNKCCRYGHKCSFVHGKEEDKQAAGDELLVALCFETLSLGTNTIHQHRLDIFNQRCSTVLMSP
jgi:hypothetical protein